MRHGSLDPARVEPGDERSATFVELYRAHYDSVGNLLYRRSGDRTVTEDLLHEVFLAAWKGLDRARRRAVPLRFWLYRIATNRANTWARRAAREAARSSAPERSASAARSAESDAMVREEQRLARAALLRLPPAFQAVVTLHHLEELSVEEIALVLGCSVGTVKSRLHRGRARLREILAPKIDERTRR